jgi:hypothetical protein
LSPIAIVGFSALGVLVVGWLVVSFSAPSRRREVVEWISATALYAVLLMLFLNLCLRAREADSTVALVAFGFLCVLFGGGLILGIVEVFRSARGRRGVETTTTN